MPFATDTYLRGVFCFNFFLLFLCRPYGAHNSVLNTTGVPVASLLAPLPKLYRPYRAHCATPNITGVPVASLLAPLPKLLRPYGTTMRIGLWLKFLEILLYSRDSIIF